MIVIVSTLWYCSASFDLPKPFDFLSHSPPNPYFLRKLSSRRANIFFLLSRINILLQRPNSASGWQASTSRRSGQTIRMIARCTCFREELHVYKKIELPCFCQRSTSSIIWMVDVLLMAHEVLPRYYYMQVWRVNTGSAYDTILSD